MQAAAVAGGLVVFVAVAFGAVACVVERCERRLASRIAEMVEQRLGRRPPEPPGSARGLFLVRRSA